MARYVYCVCQLMILPSHLCEDTSCHREASLFIKSGLLNDFLSPFMDFIHEPWWEKVTVAQRLFTKFFVVDIVLNKYLYSNKRTLLNKKNIVEGPQKWQWAKKISLPQMEFEHREFALFRKKKTVD